MQNPLCPSPSSNAVTHIATTSEHPFSFFVFLCSSLPLLCLCPFFLLYWQYQEPVSRHFSPPFPSPLFPYAARRNPFLKPVTLFWHLKQSRLKLVLRKQGIQWLSLDKTLASTSCWWPFRLNFCSSVRVARPWLVGRNVPRVGLLCILCVFSSVSNV